MKANVDKCHLVTRDTDVTAKIGEIDVKDSREGKTSWCQNRWQAFFRKSRFFPLQKVTCTPKSRKFYGSSET